MTDVEKIVEILNGEALECGDGGIYDPAGCAQRILDAFTAPPRPDHAGGVSEDEALRYAESLCRALYEKHWTVDAPEWQPLAGDLIGLLSQIDNMTAGLTRAATPTPPTPDSTAQGDGTSQEIEDAYIARVLAMSSSELAAEAEAVGVKATKPRSLPTSLRNLRLRLESALANRLEEGDREAIAWLNEGVIAIGAVLASLPVPADREGGR